MCLFGIKYDDRLLLDDWKSIRDGWKASVVFYTRCYCGIYAGTFAVWINELGRIECVGKNFVECSWLWSVKTVEVDVFV